MSRRAHRDGLPICIDWDLEGDLVIVDGSSKQLLRHGDGTTEVVADLWYADVPNRHCRHLDPEGNVIDTIDFDRGCFSCAISPEGELFVTATVWDDNTFSTRRGVLYRAHTRR